jgi:hypothetical protein
MSTQQFTVSTQQVLSQAMVASMSVGIMSIAMGIAMSSMGASAYTKAPRELKGTNIAITDLKLAFGDKIVTEAVRNVGKESMLTLAGEVERLVKEDMYEKYGRTATYAALEAATPGDIWTAREIAASLAAYGVGKQAAVIPPVVAAKATENGKKRAHQKAKPVRDTKTGVEYKSKSAAGMAVAAEYNMDPNNTFVWYEVIKKDPNRFVTI